MSVALINLLKLALPLLKISLAAFFFYRFLRNPSPLAGIGLLTITAAVLLDAAASVFGGGALAAAIGFFTPLLLGGLFGGAAAWVWGTLHPAIANDKGKAATSAPTPTPLSAASAPAHAAAARLRGANPDKLETAYDREMLAEQIRSRFGREDVLDLIFDMGLNENDLIGLGSDMNPIIDRLLDIAERDNSAGQLAMSVERILTPPHPNSLPRQEKLTADTPPTILRNYLLANYRLSQLKDLTATCGVDWERLKGEGKQAKIRELLLYLYRRNNINVIIAAIQEE